MRPQSERLSEILKQIKIDVTEVDRKLALAKFKCTVATLSKYLNGKVQNSDTATEFIVFFKERIAERDRMTTWEPKMESQKQIA